MIEFLLHRHQLPLLGEWAYTFPSLVGMYIQKYSETLRFLHSVAPRRYVPPYGNRHVRRKNEKVLIYVQSRPRQSFHQAPKIPWFHRTDISWSQSVFWSWFFALQKGSDDFITMQNVATVEGWWRDKSPKLLSSTWTRKLRGTTAWSRTSGKRQCSTFRFLLPFRTCYCCDTANDETLHVIESGGLSTRFCFVFLTHMVKKVFVPSDRLISRALGLFKTDLKLLKTTT